MDESDLIRGWPWTDHMPLRVGHVEGIPWAIAMGAVGINGYARIPWEGHPWTGCTDYDDLEVEVHGGLTYGPKPEIDLQASIDELERATTGTDHPFRMPPRDHDIPVTPAVTFADCGGWVGFDTGHGGDVWTEQELARWGGGSEVGRYLREHLPNTWAHGHRWTGEEVIAEAKSLASQIALAGGTDMTDDQP